MTVPTRIIEKEQFRQLMAQEQGDVIVLYKLEAIPFNPPVPGQVYKPNRQTAHINLLLLNTVEPLIFKDKERSMVFLIANKYNEEEVFTYDYLQDLHPRKGAWAYRVSPGYWQEGDLTYPLEDSRWVFNHGEEKK